MSQDASGPQRETVPDIARIRAAFAAREARVRHKSIPGMVVAGAYLLVAGWLAGWTMAAWIAGVVVVAIVASHALQSKARSVRRERLARAATDDVEMAKLYRDDLKQDIEAARSAVSSVWLWSCMVFAACFAVTCLRYSAHPGRVDDQTERIGVLQFLGLLVISSTSIPRWLRARKDLPRLLRECADIGPLGVRS